MSWSGQLDRHCTIELNYSSMSAHLASASVTYEHALESYEPSCVSVADRSFFISVVHNPLGVMGYVTALELSSR
jgi:hypothetical protein